MSRLIVALFVGLCVFCLTPTEGAARETDNMDKCVYFGWRQVSTAPSIFEYRLKNYCKRRIYVQVCVDETDVCRSHYLNKLPREVEHRVQDPYKKGERMTYRAVEN